MAKLSLDATIGLTENNLGEISGISRRVTRKDAKNAVANSLLCEKKYQNNVNFRLKVTPYVTEKMVMQQFLEMLLLFKRENSVAIPFFSILEPKTKLLNLLIEKSGLSAKEFITAKIITPLAEMVVEQLFCNKMSVEIHPQNLLLLVDKETGAPEKFLLRDMNGINAIPDHTILSSDLQDDSFFYAANHPMDASRTIEKHLVGLLLFELSRFVFENKGLDDMDWKNWCNEELTTKNFSYNLNSILEQKEFVRYSPIDIDFATAIDTALDKFKIKESLKKFDKITVPEGTYMVSTESRSTGKQLLVDFEQELDDLKENQLDQNNQFFDKQLYLLYKMHLHLEKHPHLKTGT